MEGGGSLAGIGHGLMQRGKYWKGAEEQEHEDFVWQNTFLACGMISDRAGQCRSLFSESFGDVTTLSEIRRLYAYVQRNHMHEFGD